MRYQKVRLSLIGVVLTLLFSCSLQEKLIKPGVKLNREMEVNGKKIKTGLWIENKDSGWVQIANYVNGSKQGKVKTLRQDGFYSIAEYKNDLPDGVTKYYDKDGIVFREETYETGKRVRDKIFSPHF